METYPEAAPQCPSLQGDGGTLLCFPRLGEGAGTAFTSVQIFFVVVVVK